MRPLERLGIGKIDARLQPGHVAVGRGLAVLPEREAGELLRVELQADAAIARPRSQQGLGLALGVGGQLEVEDRLGPARRRRSIRVPLGELGHGRRVARGQLLHRQQHFGPGPQQGQAEVDVIEQLQLARLRRKIADGVGDGQAGLAHPSGHRRAQPQLGPEEPRLVDRAADGDLAAVAIHGDLDPWAGVLAILPWTP